jgi:thiamine-monophosphate kinase
MEDLDPVELAVSGGDDYELLFTAPEAASERLVEHSAAFRVPVARIGLVHAGAGAALRGPRGEREIAECGYDHLEAPR